MYSLGAVAYFLLTGRPPFTGRSVLETLSALLHESPAAHSARGADVEADLDAVILRCLAKSSAERFADAALLEQALRGCGCADRWDEAQAREWWQERWAGVPGVAEGCRTGNRGPAIWLIALPAR